LSAGNANGSLERCGAVRACHGRGGMIFVFEVRIKDGYTAERYARAWVRASSIIQQAAGARGTRLHRKIGEPNILLAIAHWESKTARDAMEARPDSRVREIIAEQAPGCEIRVIGEFDDPAWVVGPATGGLDCCG
jgi:hypothetical protein